MRSKALPKTNRGRLEPAPLPGISVREPMNGSKSHLLSSVKKRGDLVPKETRLNRTTLEAKKDLESVYDYAAVKQIAADNASGSLSPFMARHSINLNNPKLGSIQEFMKDLWQEEAETFAVCKSTKSRTL